MQRAYKILGLTKESSFQEVKNAYKLMVKQYHPDVATEKNALLKFREIQEAYGLLKAHYEKLTELENLSKDDLEVKFKSKRPQYDGTVGSQMFRDQHMEYIQFRPKDIPIPYKDRLGIEYKPLFQDEDTTHPKAGTLLILFCCTITAGIASKIFLDMRKHDQQLHALLNQKIQKEYKEKGWDPEKDGSHPALQIFRQEKGYQKFLKKEQDFTEFSKFLSYKINPATVQTFSINEGEFIDLYEDIKTE